MQDQKDIDDKGGTMRLGLYPCQLKEGSKSYESYGKPIIDERHRHRYEVNNEYREVLEEKGMMISGVSPDGKLVEMIELKDHPWFVATQAHPEFKSRPNKAHPLFREFVKSAKNNRQ
jgi:CTP synthase